MRLSELRAQLRLGDSAEIEMAFTAAEGSRARAAKLLGVRSDDVGSLLTQFRWLRQRLTLGESVRRACARRERSGFRVGAAPSKFYRTANAKMHLALKRGLIGRSSACEECGSMFGVVAHHDDYARPLDVRWLCSKCHSAWHATNGPGANRYEEAV